MARLTFEPGLVDYPVWTADGAFLAVRARGTLAWLRSDGGGTVEHVAGTDRDAVPWSFSPDGKWLAFHQSDAHTGSDLWVVPVERAGGAMQLGQPQPLLQQEGQQYAPAVSPDGRWLAYQSDESGRAEVYVMPFTPTAASRNGKWQVSVAGGFWPEWSRSSGELFFRSPDRRVMCVNYSAKDGSFAAGKPRVWADKQLARDVGEFSSFDVAPDGKRVAGLFDAEDAGPERHLRVLLNVGDELRRRAATGRAKPAGK